MLQELKSKFQLITMRKAVAIPYVITLILGMIAIGILAYWFINQSGKTTNVGTSAECQAKAFSYCLAWQNNDKNCGPTERPDRSVLGTCLAPTVDECNGVNLCKG